MNNIYYIKDIAKVTNGKSDVKDTNENGRYVFFDRSILNKKSNKYLFDDEAIIIPGEDSREIFDPRYYHGKFDLHQRCYAIYDFKKGYYPKYLYYKLKTLTKHFSNVFVGSTVPSLRLDHITDLKIDFPSLDTQKKIASVLSSLDAKIEINLRINAELEAMAKTLYDYWFVQFDFPDENGMPYKSSGGRVVYNTQLERDIPEDWEVKKLEKATKTFLGGTPSTENRDFWNGDIPWLNSGEVADFPIITTSQKISQEAIKNSATNLLPSGTVLLSITRHLRPNILGIDACVNQSVVGIKENEYFKKSFLYLYISNEIPRLMTLRTGAQQPHINKEIVDSSTILIPSRNVLEKFYSISEPVFERIISLSKQNQQLTQLRNWLLPMLMNGQVTVVNTYQEEEESYAMAAEPAAEYNQSITLPIPENRNGFAKQVLGGKIVSLFKDDPHFTHIKFQKLQFLAEHVAEADLNLNYYFQAAGPHDGAYMNTIANHFRTNQWFDEQNYRFLPLQKQNKIEGYYQDYFSPVANRLERLFTLLANATEAEAEIIATLYAVWNNRIILKQPVSEEALIEDFYNWSDRKQQYSREQLLQGLQWLKTNNMEPKGFGREIRRAKIIK